MQYEAFRWEKEKKEEELHQDVKEGRQLVEAYEAQITEEKQYEAFVGKKGEEEQQLHQEIREMKEQEKQLQSEIKELYRVVEEASTENESRQSRPPVPINGKRLRGRS